MAYLLDTHIVLWLANEPHNLTDNVKNLLLDKKETIYFSTVNIWEIAIKSSLKKDSFSVNLDKLYQQLIYYSYLELPIVAKHCMQVEKLPLHHKDPFDRLLIAQAITENLTLVTHDSLILQYDIDILRA